MRERQYDFRMIYREIHDLTSILDEVGLEHSLTPLTIGTFERLVHLEEIARQLEPIT